MHVSYILVMLLMFGANETSRLNFPLDLFWTNSNKRRPNRFISLTDREKMMIYCMFYSWGQEECEVFYSGFLKTCQFS